MTMFLTTAGVNPLFGPITWSLPSEDLEQGKKFLEHFYRVRLGAHEIESLTRKIYQTRKIRLITIKHTLRIRIQLLEREVQEQAEQIEDQETAFVQSPAEQALCHEVYNAVATLCGEGLG